jgi:cellulose biosynthesis protein BcsQ
MRPESKPPKIQVQLMSIPELLRFFEELIQKKQLPAFLCGMFLGFSLMPLLLRLIKRWLFHEVVNDLKTQIKVLTEEKAESFERIDELQDRRDQLEREKAEIAIEGQAKDEQVAALGKELERLSGEKDLRIAELSKACEAEATKLADIRLRLNKDRKVRRNLQKMVNSYIDQLDQITNSDGKIWEKKANGQAVPFVPLSQRKTAIISLLNLKGGVGKTTLTANLGAALAAQGLRVLLIDLDHQSSLTNLCLSTKERQEAKESNRFIDNFFEEGGDFEAFRRCVTRSQAPTGPGQLHVAAVTESFVNVENKLQARWAVGLLTEDVRYRLRKGLHSAWLREHYDVVLIDCPPRWSTGSVNAIVSSDYVLIPVLLENMSTEAVPRILNWLGRFQSNCCPELNLLGVVGNKATNREGDKLIGREKTTWIATQENSRHAWNAPIKFFEEIIREHSTAQGPFASLDPSHQARYANLIGLIRKEIPHAYLQSTAIHPFADAPVGGGRA